MGKTSDPQPDRLAEQGPKEVQPMGMPLSEYKAPSVPRAYKDPSTFEDSGPKHHENFGTRNLTYWVHAPSGVWQPLALEAIV